MGKWGPGPHLHPGTFQAHTQQLLLLGTKGSRFFTVCLLLSKQTLLFVTLVLNPTPLVYTVID